MERRETTPGLKYRKRARGAPVPYWCAKPAAVTAGYPVKTVNLTNVEDVAGRCQQLEEEMYAWLDGASGKKFDGTLGVLVAAYQTNRHSPYKRLKLSALKTYDPYLRLLANGYGDTRIAKMTGLQVKEWFDVWSSGGKHIAAGNVILSVLKAVLKFGAVAGDPDCVQQCLTLTQVLRFLQVPHPRPRTMAPTAAEIDRAREAAHACGRNRAAFAFALQFETFARQWDIVGQWVPMDDPRPSAILAHGQKWIGPTWSNIDANLVLSIRPSKTERTTGANVVVNLSRCPMVVEELARIPEAERVGPLIVNEGTGLPYRRQAWEWWWRKIRATAGLSPDLWNRDLRAGGITEAEAAGASVEDRAKTAGHSARINRGVYSRDDGLAAADRVVDARQAFRRKGE